MYHLLLLTLRKIGHYLSEQENRTLHHFDHRPWLSNDKEFKFKFLSLITNITTKISQELLLFLHLSYKTHSYVLLWYRFTFKFLIFWMGWLHFFYFVFFICNTWTMIKLLFHHHHSHVIIISLQHGLETWLSCVRYYINLSHH